jgi:PAS domain S-box-containing protein
MVSVTAPSPTDADALVNLLDEMSKQPELQALLRIAIVRLSGLFDIERASVVLLRQAQEAAFVVTAGEGAGLENLVVSLQDYPELQQLRREGVPQVLPAARADALGASLAAGTGEDGVAMLFPLSRKDEVVGALLLRARAHGRGGAERLREMGRLIAAVTALALGDALETDRLLSTQRELLRRQDDVQQQLAVLQQFSQVFEQSLDGALITTSDGVVRYANPAAGAILQRRPERLSEQSFTDLLAGDARRLAERAFHGDSVGDAYGYVDLEVYDEAGSATLVSAAIRPLADANAVLITFRDVTEVRTVERDLRRDRDRLQRAVTEAAAVSQTLVAAVAQLSARVRAAASGGVALDAETAEVISRESDRLASLAQALDVGAEPGG